MHPSSLPGPGRLGDLGRNAYYFVDFLVSTGQSVWQVLPLGPTHENLSPYQSLSAHAGNPSLISLELLRDWAWLDRAHPIGSTRADAAFRRAAIEEARRRFVENRLPSARAEYEDFLHVHGHWLEDYALYAALRAHQGGTPWFKWPALLRDRNAAALGEARAQFAEQLDQIRYEQYLFFRQWRLLKHYANERGVYLFGDMPIFLAHDSAEVWAQRQYFDLECNGLPARVAGVPPDYYSATGQRWGNPLYRWDRLATEDFSWWKERLQSQLHLFDLVRIDHFRGFEAYWEIPAEAGSACEGRWVPAPGDALFLALSATPSPLPLVAEDLGYITAEVRDLRMRYGFPGMKVLQFAFDGGPDNPYLPHNHEVNAVVYTGTHDNDTSLSWFESRTQETKTRIGDYLGFADEPMPWPLIRCALASVASLSIIPLQDILSLGAGHRMNTPGTVEGNWTWRFDWGQVAPETAVRLGELTKIYGRASFGPAGEPRQRCSGL